jgi:hypothetical protein
LFPQHYDTTDPVSGDSYFDTAAPISVNMGAEPRHLTAHIAGYARNPVTVYEMLAALLRLVAGSFAAYLAWFVMQLLRTRYSHKTLDR